MVFWDSHYDVLQVNREEMNAIAGLPWAEAVAGRDAAMHHMKRGYIVSQDARPTWKPPVDAHNKELLYLPLNHAWLREIDGRAFL